MKLPYLGLIGLALMTGLAHGQENSPNLLNRILKKNPVATRKVDDKCFVRSEQMLPRGSALITSSGALKEIGITAIINAATGSMTKSEGVFEPTLLSIEHSIRNSLILARRYNHKRVAIPFLAGGIFAGRMGVTKEELAASIVSSSLKYKKGLEIVFVLYTESEASIFSDALSKASEGKRGAKRSKNASVVQGSITDFELHGASAIVNAANMEVLYGGGISGFIGSATEEAEELDNKAAEIIQEIGSRCFESNLDPREDWMYDMGTPMENGWD